MKDEKSLIRLGLNPPGKPFLDELLERAKVYGWAGDYIEIKRFVCSLYEEAGLGSLSAEELECYDDQELDIHE